MLLGDFFHWLQLAGCIRSLLVRVCSIIWISFQPPGGSDPGRRAPNKLLQVPAGHHVNGLFALSETGEINETGQHLRPFIVSLSRKRTKRIYYTITLKILLGYKQTMFFHEIDSFKH